MATKWSKPVSRTVKDSAGDPLVVTILEHGVEFRRPRKRQGKVIPHGADDTDDLTKAITRTVIDQNGDKLNVTLTPDGIVFRRPGERESYLLPFKHGETRAILLSNGGIGMASDKRSKRNTPVKRGLLSLSQTAAPNVKGTKGK